MADAVAAPGAGDARRARLARSGAAFRGWAWSFIGMVLAVPILIAIPVLCEQVPALVRIAPFLAGEGGEDEARPPP